MLIEPDCPLSLAHFRDAKRKLAKSAPKRESISTESKYEKQMRLKKEEMVRASKKRKLKQPGENGAAESSEKKANTFNNTISSSEKKQNKKKMKKPTTEMQVESAVERKGGSQRGKRKKNKDLKMVSKSLPSAENFFTVKNKEKSKKKNES